MRLPHTQSALGRLDAIGFFFRKFFAPTVLALISASVAACGDDEKEPGMPTEPQVGNIRYTFCDSPTFIPKFFAVKDGRTGTWTRVNPIGNNVFSFDLAQPVATVAYVLAFESGIYISNVVSASQAELRDFGNAACTVTPASGTKTLTGSVTGLNNTAAATQKVFVALGKSGANVLANGAFTLNQVDAGALDLIATRTTVNTSTTVGTIDGVIIRRGLNLADGSTIAPLNFAAGGEAVAPAIASVTVSNAGADNVAVSSLFSTAKGGLISLGYATGSVANIYGMPASLLIAGDAQTAQVIASDVSNTSARSVALALGQFGNKTVTLPTALPAPTISSAVGGMLRPRFQGTKPVDYQNAISVQLNQFLASKTVFVSVSATHAYSPLAYDLEVPDLSMLPGFQTVWGLSAGVPTEYILAANHKPATPAADGVTAINANRTGMLPSSAIRQ